MSADFTTDDKIHEYKSVAEHFGVTQKNVTQDPFSVDDLHKMAEEFSALDKDVYFKKYEWPMGENYCIGTSEFTPSKLKGLPVVDYKYSGPSSLKGIAGSYLMNPWEKKQDFSAFNSEVSYADKIKKDYMEAKNSVTKSLYAIFGDNAIEYWNPQVATAYACPPSNYIHYAGTFDATSYYEWLVKIIRFKLEEAKNFAKNPFLIPCPIPLSILITSDLEVLLGLIQGYCLYEHNEHYYGGWFSRQNLTNTKKWFDMKHEGEDSETTFIEYWHPGDSYHPKEVVPFHPSGVLYKYSPDMTFKSWAREVLRTFLVSNDLKGYNDKKFMYFSEYSDDWTDEAWITEIGIMQNEFEKKKCTPPQGFFTKYNILCINKWFDMKVPVVGKSEDEDELDPPVDYSTYKNMLWEVHLVRSKPGETELKRIELVYMEVNDFIKSYFLGSPALPFFRRLFTCYKKEGYRVTKCVHKGTNVSLSKFKLTVYVENCAECPAKKKKTKKSSLKILNEYV